MPRLTKKAIDAIKPKPDRVFAWDDRLPGFGVRCYPNGRKVFVAQVRVGRARRRVTIGDFGLFTVEQARERAEEISRAAAAGRDPQREKRKTREALTVAKLCETYTEAARAGQKPDAVQAAEAAGDRGDRRRAHRRPHQAADRLNPRHRSSPRRCPAHGRCNRARQDGRSVQGQVARTGSRNGWGGNRGARGRAFRRDVVLGGKARSRNGREPDAGR